MLLIDCGSTEEVDANAPLLAEICRTNELFPVIVSDVGVDGTQNPFIWLTDFFFAGPYVTEVSVRKTFRGGLQKLNEIK